MAYRESDCGVWSSRRRTCIRLAHGFLSMIREIRAGVRVLRTLNMGFTARL